MKFGEVFGTSAHWYAYDVDWGNEKSTLGIVKSSFVKSFENSFKASQTNFSENVLSNAVVS